MIAEKTKSLASELQESAISESIAKLNFKELSGDSCIEYLLFATEQNRRNDGRLSDSVLKKYKHLNDGGWWCEPIDILERDSLWGCLKPNTPKTYFDKAKGKQVTIKYEHPPNTPTRPYFLRVDTDTWFQIADRFSVEMPDISAYPEESIALEFWQWVIANPKIPVVITEGAKKTACLISLGLPAVGLSGIFNGYRTPKNEGGEKVGASYLVPEIEAIAQKGREFVFCFDNDTKPQTMKNVAIAVGKMAKLLKVHTASKVSAMFWTGHFNPELKGIDDVAARMGTHVPLNLFGDRSIETKWQKLIAKEIEYATVADYEKAQLEAKEKLENAQTILKQNDPLAYSEVMNSMAESDESSNGKVLAITTTPLAPVVTYLETVDPDKSAEVAEPPPEPELSFEETALQETFFDCAYISIHDDLYKFNGRYYEKQPPALVKKKIIAWASKKAVYDPRSRRMTYRYMNSASINKITSWVIDRTAINPEDINPPGVNLANGVLKIKWQGRTPTWKLYPHSPREYFTYCSEVEYNPKADPTQCNKLLECLDPAPRTALLRQLAAAFDLPTVRLLHSRGIKAAIAKGTGANGKDSIRAAISKIFCGQMTGLGLSEFQAYDNGRKFGLSMLEHSLVNWSSENNMGTTLDRVEALNICVTGEEGGIMIERKGKDSYAFTPKAIHIFNTNQIPKLRSGMESLLSRFVVYDFNKTFKQNPNPKRGELQADPRFHDDPQFLIKEVCPALLNRLLGELKNLAIEGIDYDALKAGLDEIQEESTHLWAFVNETGLESDPDGKVGITELWESLKEWYLDTGTLVLDEPEPGRFKYTWHEQANPHDRNVTGSNQVYKRFKQLFPNIKRDRETSDQQSKGRFFIFGLKLKDSSSLLHFPDSARVSASPDASLFDSPSYSASLSLGEAKNEAVVKQQTLAVQGSEAVKQNFHIMPNSATPEDPSQDDEDLVPEYFQQFGYVFPLGKILVHAVTGRTVMTTEFTLSGSPRTNKEYLCTFVDDETTAYIPQNELQEL